MVSYAFQNGFSLMRSYLHFVLPVFIDRYEASGEKSSSALRLQGAYRMTTLGLQDGYR